MLIKKPDGSYVFGFWSEGQIRALHLASLEILERVGVRVQDSEALRIFAEAGAFVDGDLVRIPAGMVRDALSGPPERVVLADRNGSRKVYLEPGKISFGAGCGQPYFMDPQSREIRLAEEKDAEKMAAMAQYAPNIDFVACLAGSRGSLADLCCFRAVRACCIKPVVVRAASSNNMRILLEMAAASAAGGRDGLRRNPSLAFVLKGEPPLIYDAETTRQIFLAAENGIPVVFAPVIIPGKTAPAKIIGSLALGNAAVLSGLVLHQLKHWGAPFIYGIEFAFCEGEHSSAAGPEVAMMQALAAQIAQFYGLPAWGSYGTTDSFAVDAQAGAEAIFFTLVAALGGANLAFGGGELGSGTVGSPAKVLFDDECISFTKHFLKGIELSEETLALEVIERVGPGGSFLAEEHTFRYFKKETWYPSFLNRKPLKTWLEEGIIKTIADLVSDRAAEVLETFNVEKLPDSVLAEMDRIIDKAGDGTLYTGGN
ncbi:MAG: hypothetical protein HPY58_03130 [Firmicutes bacterium]|nr:hypothetical protein [Bacillota bacterium]